MDVVRVLSNGKSSVINWNQLSPVIPTSTDDLALAFFYTKTLENLPTTDHAHYLHLQLSSLYTTNTHHSALHLAALAISHIVYSRDTRNNIQASQISRKYYVQAIIAINAALRDPVKARSDQTLYAVLLLCGYEVSSLLPPDPFLSILISGTVDCCLRCSITFGMGFSC